MYSFMSLDTSFIPPVDQKVLLLDYHLLFLLLYLVHSLIFHRIVGTISFLLDICYSLFLMVFLHFPQAVPLFFLVAAWHLHRKDLLLSFYFSVLTLLTLLPLVYPLHYIY